MKLLTTSLCVLAAMVAQAAPPHHGVKPDAGQRPLDRIVQLSSASQQQAVPWLDETHTSPPTKRSMANLKSEPDGKLSNTSSWGTLTTSHNEMWMYTLDLEEENNSYTAATVTIYNAKYELNKKFRIEFELGPGETSINSVMLSPVISRKFFHIDDNYEVMVFVHATTEDYVGRCYTNVYSLKDGSLIQSIEGNHIGAVDCSVDEWSERFTMAFMREEFTEQGYNIYIDVYNKASWGNNATLAHTFKIDYSKFAGAEMYALPFLMTQYNKQMYYALPHYEKQFFVDPNNWENPQATPNNNFIIELYDSNFELVKTTTIPMAEADGALYSFPGMGCLMSNDDLSFGLFNDGDLPVYVVGYENYVIELDGYLTDYVVYDTDGKVVKKLFTNSYDFMRMSEIDGCESQFCFITTTPNGTAFNMVDIPSGKNVAEIDALLPDGNTITTAFDRVPAGDSYKYVSSLSQADVDYKGNALHRFAWFNTDGDLENYDTINLGDKIAVAYPYVYSDGLDPFLFNTDSHREYMFLVKVYEGDETTKSGTFLRIYSDNSDLILDVGPDEDGDQVISTVFLQNPASSSGKLVLAYMGQEYSIRYFDLPLYKFAGGDGSIQHPYVISCPGDLMSVYTEPYSNYVIDANLDFNGIHWKGNACDFRGTLDGQDHVIYNLNLNGKGLFQEISSGAEIKNFEIQNSTLNATGDAGFIAGYACGETKGKHPVISKIKVFNSEINGTDGFYGGILGTSVVYTAIEECLVKDTNIETDGDAVAGGIVGRMQTSSTVDACAFVGDIKADLAGGIAGTTQNGDETITNCHATANIEATSAAGGILGYSSRSVVANCYAQGNIKVEGNHAASAGGIVGELKELHEDDTFQLVVSNCISNLESIEAITHGNADAIAHRIVGLSSGQMLFVDWEHVTPDMEPKDYPYISGSPETALSNNYAIGLAPIDPTFADDKNYLEGASIALTDITEQFVTDNKYKLGETVDSPWKLAENDLHIYFEKDQPGTSIHSISSFEKAKIDFDGRMLQSAGSQISVYAISGALVATGFESVDTSVLASGVYVAVSGGKVLKFSVK